MRKLQRIYAARLRQVQAAKLTGGLLLFATFDRANGIAAVKDREVTATLTLADVARILGGIPALAIPQDQFAAVASTIRWLEEANTDAQDSTDAR